MSAFNNKFASKQIVNANQCKSAPSTPSIAIATSNKLVYISRIEQRFVERDVIDILVNARIGKVQYVDFVAVKDNAPKAGSNPALKFYSAFVMMTEWNQSALADILGNEQIKVWVNDHVYWILRLAKEGSEIPRSKVNIHQLASYTAELYTRIDVADKRAEDQAKIIADQAILLATQASQIQMLMTTVSHMDAFLTAKFYRPEEEEDESVDI